MLCQLLCRGLTHRDKEETPVWSTYTEACPAQGSGRDMVEPPQISRAMQSYTGKVLACPGWVLENSAALDVNGTEEGAERGEILP